MALFLSTAEGRGKPLTKTGTPQTGVRAMAGTWNVRGEAGAFFDNPAMGGLGPCLALRLQAMTGGPKSGHTNSVPIGPFFEMWTGTEAAALELVGLHGPQRQAAALRALAKRLEHLAVHAETTLPRPIRRTVT